MPKSRIQSPARSVGAPNTLERSIKYTLRNKKMSRSVGSPTQYDSPFKLSTVGSRLKENNMPSFNMSVNSVLSDNTQIEEPKRRSWWKRVQDTSRSVLEVLDNNKINDREVNDIIQEYVNVDVLSQEKRNQTFDLPDSSDNESYKSIVVPQRKLFSQQQRLTTNRNYQQLQNQRESSESNKTVIDVVETNVVRRKLLNQGTRRTKLEFPAALLNLSTNESASNKTKDLANVEIKTQTRTLFGKKEATKRKNIFANFVLSDSEDEMPEVQPRIFAFKNPSESNRRNSWKLQSSPASSTTTDLEIDEWKYLPSSTMVENQLEEIVTSPVKKARVSKISETKGSNSISNKSKLSTRSLRNNTSKQSNKNHSEMNDEDNSKNQLHRSSRRNNNSKSQEKSKTIIEISQVYNNEQNLEQNSKHMHNYDKHEESVSSGDISIQYVEDKVDGEADEEEDKELEIEEEIDNVDKVEDNNSRGESNEENINEEEQRISNDTDVVEEMEDNSQRNIDQIKSDENIEKENEENNFNKDEQEIENDVEEMEEHQISHPEIEETEGVEVEDNEMSEGEQEVQDENEEVEDVEVEDNEMSEEEQEVQDENEEVEDVEVEDNEMSEEEQEVQDENEEVENVEVEDNEMSEEEQEVQDENEEIEDDQNDGKESENFIEEEQKVQDENEEIDDDQIDGNESQNLIEDHETNREIDCQEATKEWSLQPEIHHNVVEGYENNDLNEEELENPNEIHDVTKPDVEYNSVQNEEGHDADGDVEKVEELPEWNEIEENDDENNDLNEEGRESGNEIDEMQEENVPLQELEDSDRDENDEDIHNVNDSVNDMTDSKNNFSTSNRNSRNNGSLHNRSVEAALCEKRNIKSLTIPINKRSLTPNLEPQRASTRYSSELRESSEAGSGWDSHRITRRTLRQTFGKNFSPRKSLRTLVMEKSAKRQTAVNSSIQNNDDINELEPRLNKLKENVFENSVVSMDDDIRLDLTTESDHEASRIRQEREDFKDWIQKVQQKNLEAARKIEETVKENLARRSKDKGMFKVPAVPIQRKKNETKKPRKPQKTKENVFPVGIPPEFFEDMKYKPPKKFAPTNAPWITKRLYKYIEDKLEPRYGCKTRIRAEKLMMLLYEFTKEVRKCTVAAPIDYINHLKYVMAKLNIVKTHYDFNNFFDEFMPYGIRTKVIPNILNGLPLPKPDLFSDIIQNISLNR